MALTGGPADVPRGRRAAEALELQAALPSALGGTGLVLLGVAVSYLALTWVSHRLSAAGAAERRGAPSAGVALATLVAIGIGLHNLGEGLAIGSSFALGELALGTFLIVGFMVHNVTEGLGIAAPIAEGGARAGSPGWRAGPHRRRAGDLRRLARRLRDERRARRPVLRRGRRRRAEVVVEVGRYVARRAPGGLASGYVVGGFLAGIAIMYVTGLIAG